MENKTCGFRQGFGAGLRRLVVVWSGCRGGSVGEIVGAVGRGAGGRDEV